MGSNSSPQTSPAEDFFDDFIDQIGGERVGKHLNSSPSFKNADYVIHYAEHIIELKCLEKDHINDKNFIENLINNNQLLIANYVGYSELEQNLTNNHLSLFVNSLIGHFYQPIERIVRSANKQIKETKNHLNFSNYKGILWILNENNSGLQPSYLIDIITRLLNHKDFSSINAVVLGNLNLPSQNPETGQASIYWIPLFRENTEGLCVDFVHYLGHRWKEHLVQNNIAEDNNGLGHYRSRDENQLTNLFIDPNNNT